MTRAEFDRLVEPNRHTVFDPSTLADTSDRTLIFGHDHEHRYIHVYLKGGIAHKSVSNAVNVLWLESGLFQFVKLCPYKIFPGHSDYQFCLLLKHAGLDLEFTTYYSHVKLPDISND